MLAQRLSDASEILAKLGGECAAEYKYDGVRVQAHRTADGRIELFTRRLERVSTQFPDVVELLAAGLGPREAILEGEVVAYDPAAGELHPFQEVMFRRRKHGIAEAVRDVPVGLFCFELLYADGQDLTRLPYPQRRAALAEAITVSPRLRLTTAIEVSTPTALDAAFEQAVTDGCEGLVCKSVAPDAIYQAGARGWLWIKLKRDYRTELSDTIDLVVVGAFAGRGRRAGVYGAVLLAAYDPAADVFRTVTKCGAGFSDADLAALPARLAPLASAHRPARVDARQEPDVWFEPGLVLEILSAELTLSPNYTAGWGQIKDDAGLAMRFPRFTGRWRDDKARRRRHHHRRTGRPVPHRPANTGQRSVAGRGDRHRGEMHREAAPRRVDDGADARQQFLPLDRRELAVAAGGRHQFQPLVPGVGPVPVVSPLLRVAERGRLPYPVGRLGKERRVPVQAGHYPAGEGRVGQYPAVDRGEGFGQVGRRLEHVPEHGEPSAGPQGLRRLDRSRDGVHPVPGLPGDDRVEIPAGAFPVFELRHLGLHPGPPGEVSHPRVGLDPEHPAAGRLELPGGYAGPAADVQDVGPGAGGDDPVHHGVGVARPDPVVASGVRAERLRYLPGLMRLLFRHTRAPEV